MKTIWDWLEIEQTTDKTAIRNAYANQVKKYHPEEHPEEAQELRKAYKQAMEQASGKSKSFPQLSGFFDTNIGDEKPTVEDNKPLKVELSQKTKDEQPELVYRFGKSEEQRAEDSEQSVYVYRLKSSGEQQEDVYENYDEDQQDGYVYRLSKLQIQQDYEDNDDDYDEKNNEAEQSRYVYRFGRDEKQQNEQYKEKHNEQYKEQHNQEKDNNEQTLNQQQEPPKYVYYRNKSEKQQNNKQDLQPGKFNYTNKNSYLDANQRQRLETFIKGFEIIYNNDEFCRYVGAWEVLFKNHPQKKDFANAVFVEEIIAVLEQTNRIESDIDRHFNVWRYFEKELFRYEDNGGAWVRLRERFERARSLVNKEVISNKYKKTTKRPVSKPVVAKMLYGEKSSIYKKYKLRDRVKYSCFIGVFLAIFVFAVVGKQKINEENAKEDNKKEFIQSIKDIQNNGDYKIEIPTQGVTVLPGLANAYRVIYAEGYPYKIDLNSDNIPEYVYFDKELQKYVVAYCNDATKEYEVECTLEEYLKEHPEKEDERLKYFVDPEPESERN